MGRFIGKPIENWRNYVYIKTNAIELIKTELNTLFSKIADLGTIDVKVEYLNLSPYILKRMKNFIKHEPKQMQSAYQTSQLKSYQDETKNMVDQMLEKYGFNLRFGKIIHHTGKQYLTGKSG